MYFSTLDTRIPLPYNIYTNTQKGQTVEDLKEFAYFYGDYSELVRELRQLEEAEGQEKESWLYHIKML